MQPIVFTVIAVALLLGLPGATTAQTLACEVTITAPKGEDRVGAQGGIIGTAQIPPNAYMWIFARRDDQPRIFLWPQQGIAAADLVQSPAGGLPKFEASVHYGERVDTNKNFRIIVIVVDAA